jgi:hypothetical protein
MAVSWEQFYPYVQPHVPGCPEIVVKAHLQEAAADFCARSEVWRYDIERDFTSRNTPDYEIEVPSGAVLENITALYINDGLIQKVSDRHVSTPSGAATGQPLYYSIYQDTQIKFYPTPDDTYTFEGAGVLKPRLNATGVEDFIFESHGRSISCGAIANLTIIPGKEWTNNELSMYYRAKFHKAADDAKGRDYRRVNLRVAPMGFDRATYRRGF